MNAFRQAALVVAKLDRDAADDLLERMPDEHARAIRDELAFLDDTDANDAEHVIEEFLETTGGKAETILDSETERHATLPIPVQCSSTSLAELTRHDDEKIAEAIRYERATIVAALLRSMPQRQAAKVLQRLPPSTQWLVLNHLNRGQLANETIVEVIADRICELLSQARMESVEPQIDALHGIFCELDNRQQESMLQTLEVEQPMLAQRLRASIASVGSCVRAA